MEIVECDVCKSILTHIAIVCASAQMITYMAFPIPRLKKKSNVYIGPHIKHKL